MRKLLSSPYVRATLVLVVVLAIDQLSKLAISHEIATGEKVRLLPGVQLVHVRNHGVAFGLAARDQTLVSVFVAVALIALLAYFFTHASRPLVWLPTGLLLGGALGNLFDRVRSGSVVDFVQLPLGWPPFNLADVSIVVGVVLLLLVIKDDGSMRGDRRGPAAEPSARAGADPGLSSSTRSR